jgi:hypothetical protein
LVPATSFDGGLRFGKSGNLVELGPKTGYLLQHSFERQILDLRIVDDQNFVYEIGHGRNINALGKDAVSIQNCQSERIAAT